MRLAETLRMRAVRLVDACFASLILHSPDMDFDLSPQQPRRLLVMATV
ncbi:MAG: hypothetical protein OXH83_13800 [Bryobacterales bacterium]|nr:hypothetical protein [Bryobacterales bacterium]